MNTRRMVCECGFVAQGEDDPRFIASVQAHAASAHGMVLGDAEILQMAEARRRPSRGADPAGASEGGDEAPGRRAREQSPPFEA